MTAKKTPIKAKTAASTQSASKSIREKFSSPVEAELAQIPIETIAGIAASLYKHDQYPAISLLKAYELLAGAVTTRNAMIKGREYRRAALEFGVNWDDEKRIDAFITTERPEDHLPKMCRVIGVRNDEVLYSLKEVLISFMPNHSPTEREYKFDDFLAEIEGIIEEEDSIREDCRQINPKWDGADQGFPPEPYGDYKERLRMIYNPSKHIREWTKSGMPSWIYYIARHRIWPWLKEAKSRSSSESAKERWNKKTPDAPAGNDEIPVEAKAKSGRGRVKSKKDKRLGPRLPEWGKKLKKIVKGT